MDDDDLSKLMDDLKDDSVTPQAITPDPDPGIELLSRLDTNTFNQFETYYQQNMSEELKTQFKNLVDSLFSLSAEGLLSTNETITPDLRLANYVGLFKQLFGLIDISQFPI